MNTNIVISLDTRREKKDKTYPLVMRLGHNERTTSIPIGVSLLEKDWDSKNVQQLTENDCLHRKISSKQKMM